MKYVIAILMNTIAKIMLYACVVYCFRMLMSFKGPFYAHIILLRIIKRQKKTNNRKKETSDQAISWWMCELSMPYLCIVFFQHCGLRQANIWIFYVLGSKRNIPQLASSILLLFEKSNSYEFLWKSRQLNDDSTPKRQVLALLI